MKVLLLLLAVIASAQTRVGFVGTYTRGDSKGIYAFRFQAGTGVITKLGLAVETSNPSFLVVHPNQRFLYAANENATGTISSFAIDSFTGQLTPLNQVLSRGSGPCHVSLDKTGKWLFAANYNSGSVAVLPIRDNGNLGDASALVQHSGSSVDKERQAGPHAHAVLVSPDNRFLLVNDLGLDQVLVYKFDAEKGTLTAPVAEKLTPGSGPRHLAFRPDGKFAYVINEMLETVTAFSFSAGKLDPKQTLSALPAEFTGAKSGAEIAVHPNGKFVYASNRGHDSIAVFGIDGSKGTLTALGHVPTQGKTPRSFAIDPAGNYLFAANQDSGSVVLFRIDQKTGGLTPTGTTLDVPFPVSIAFR